jgi:hypothetical protein
MINGIFLKVEMGSWFAYFGEMLLMKNAFSYGFHPLL